MMKKYYIEFHHPTVSKVLWHYYAMGESEEAVKDAATKRFIAEQMNGILLDTGGLFLVTIEEEKE